MGLSWEKTIPSRRRKKLTPTERRKGGRTDRRSIPERRKGAGEVRKRKESTNALPTVAGKLTQRHRGGKKGGKKGRYKNLTGGGGRWRGRCCKKGRRGSLLNENGFKRREREIGCCLNGRKRTGNGKRDGSGKERTKDAAGFVREAVRRDHTHRCWSKEGKGAFR